MDEMELELKARQDSMARFEDQSGRDGADASLILADALTYAAGASAFITAAIDAIENGGFDRRIGRENSSEVGLVNSDASRLGPG